MIRFLFLVFAFLSIALAQGEEEIDFNRDIRPLLSDNCFACHGPDEHDRKADLRLDTEEGSREDHDGVVAIVPGDLKKSEFWYRIITDDEDDLMPPEKTGKKLDAKQKELLKRWIESGATYEQHWAYKPVERPAQRDLKSVVDHFVEKGRVAKKLPKAGPADPRTLVRRLHLDLHGLPPSPEVVEKFAADPSSEAYQKLVEGLLKDVAYGERMAVFWLDLVRYADTIGYHSDPQQFVSPYREYVVNAFHKNMPYHQFAKEQLAGDLLPEPTRDQLVASGYNRLLQSTEEGGAQAKEYIAIHAADRVRNFSSVFLGSTLGCAQCHDHKYDPFTARDFYTTAAFFADIKEKPIGRRDTNLKLPTKEQEAEMTRIKAELAEFTEEKVIAKDGELRRRMAAEQAAWEKSVLAVTSDQMWTVTEPTRLRSQHGVQLKKLADGSILSSGPTPAKVIHTVDFKATGTVRAIQLEALMDPSFKVSDGLSRGGNGNIVMTKFRVQKDNKNLNLASAAASFEQGGYPVASAIGKAKGGGWAVGMHEAKNRGHNRSALFVLEEPLELGEKGETLIVHLHFESAHAQHSIDRFRVSVTGDEAPALKEGIAVPEEIKTILALAPEKRNPQQQTKLQTHHRGISAELRTAMKGKIAMQTKLTNLEKGQRKMMVSESLPKPRMTRILNRGDWQDEKGEVVEPAVPAFLAGGLAPKEGERLNRLDLAEWLVDGNNPLTARAFVNRVWSLFFGRGLSSNLEDLGGQGVPPTHPELLDFLAAEFVESGWDVQHIVWLIVNSEAYRRSSVDPPGLSEADPNNLWLARQGRWRLEAEFVRDTALSVSGLLHHQVEGESVKPYQPVGYWSQLNFPKRKWQADQGEDLYRRGLYTYWCRSFLHPAMLAFDAPSREECTAQRPRSNTPQQALVLLNDPVFVEAARAFAEQTTASAKTDEGRIDHLFREALARAPSDAERKLLTDLVGKARARFTSDPVAAEAFLAVGTKPRAEGIDPVDLAVWTTVSRAILNTYECISRF